MSVTDEGKINRGAARIDSPDAAIAAAEELAVRFASDAADRDLDRRLPYGEIDTLARSGLLAITVPAEYCGPDLAPSVVAEVTRILATADPNIAQIPHSHFVYLNLLRLAGSEPLARKHFSAVLEGARIANAQSERGGATIADIATTLRAVPGGGVVPGGGLVLEGEKFYATGSLFADTLAVLARYDGVGADESTDAEEGGAGELLAPGEYVAFIRADAAGVEVIDDWDALGQRTTGSGTVRFSQVAVSVDDVVGRAAVVAEPTGYGAFAQLLHVAIDVGIARGALDAAIEFVRTSSRPWFEAGVARAVDDELLVQRFGELGVDLIAAEATLAAAARAVDRATGYAATSGASGLGAGQPGAGQTGAGQTGAGQPRGGEVDSDAHRHVVAEASIAVAAAKVVADRVANDLSAAVFEVSGTRSAAAGTGLDRFWRNARTHTLHDPVRWKLQHIGRWILRNQYPPVHGVI